MRTSTAPHVSKEIRESLVECRFTLLETMAMPFDWIRLKLKHEAKPHPFELDYDGTMESLINAVEYCNNILGDVLKNNAPTDTRGNLQQMRNDLVALAHKLVQYKLD